MGPTTPFRFTDSRVEDSVLVFDIAEQELHGDEPMAAFGRELLATVDRSGVNNAVLNFTRVTYLTSAAFEPLTGLLHYIRERNGRLILCGLSPLIAEVFEATELIGVGPAPGLFETRRDVEAALAAFRESASI